MKFHKRIHGGQYPILFEVFLNYGNADKEAIYARLSRGITRATFKELHRLIEATDLEEKSGWHLGFTASEAAEEYYCYLTGYVTEKVYAKLWR